MGMNSKFSRKACLDVLSTMSHYFLRLWHLHDSTVSSCLLDAGLSYLHDIKSGNFDDAGCGVVMQNVQCVKSCCVRLQSTGQNSDAIWFKRCTCWQSTLYNCKFALASEQPNDGKYSGSINFVIVILFWKWRFSWGLLKDLGTLNPNWVEIVLSWWLLVIVAHFSGQLLSITYRSSKSRNHSSLVSFNM